MGTRMKPFRRPEHIEVIQGTPWAIWRCNVCLRTRPHLVEVPADITREKWEEIDRQFASEHVSCGKGAA